jgi:hypothetical protein
VKISNVNCNFIFISVHCGSTRQTATILTMDKDHLRTGDKASCRFRFIKNPEYMHPNTRMVFREGRTKAIGTITAIYQYIPGAGASAGVGATASTSSLKKKPSQVPKSASSTGRLKGRRGQRNRSHHQFNGPSIETVGSDHKL